MLLPPPQDIVIQQDDEIRLKIVGTRVDKNDIVSLACFPACTRQSWELFSSYHPEFLGVLCSSARKGGWVGRKPGAGGWEVFLCLLGLHFLFISSLCSLLLAP